jgi:hypothetical protein
VKDGSGAALPGVVVRATSPALIEAARVAVTDRGGQNQIENLGPGTYLISATLEGWREPGTVLAYNLAFVQGGTWLQPMTTMSPRLFKITAEVDF